ncbi:unnamed protein product [Caenorhabditis nigoni]
MFIVFMREKGADNGFRQKAGKGDTEKKMPRRRIKVEIKEERPDTPETPVTPIAPTPFILPHFALPLAGNFQAGPLLFQQIAEQVRHTWNHHNQPVIPAPLNNFPRPPFPHFAGFHAVHPIPIQNIAAFQLPVVHLFQCTESALEKINRACQDALSRQPDMTLEEHTGIIRNACISSGEDINIVLKVRVSVLFYTANSIFDFLVSAVRFANDPDRYFSKERGIPFRNTQVLGSDPLCAVQRVSIPRCATPFCQSDREFYCNETLEPPMCEWKRVKLLELQEAIINTIYCQLMGVRSDEQLPALTYLPWVVRLFRDFGLPMNDTYQVTIIDRLKRNLPHISPQYWNILSSEIQIMLTHGCNPNFIPFSG